MRKTTYFLIGLLVLAALAALGLFVVVPHIVRGTAESAAESISQRLGRELRIGDVRYSPFSSITFHDVELLPGPGDGEPLFAIGRIGVEVDPWSVVAGPLVVQEMSLEHVRVRVSLSASGALALGDLPVQEILARTAPDETAETEGDSSGLTSRFSRHFPELTIDDAEIALEGDGAALLRSALAGASEEGRVALVSGHLEAHNASILEEEPVLEAKSTWTLAPVGQKITLEARYETATGALSASFKGTEPFVYTLGEHQLSVAGASYSTDSGLRLDELQLARMEDGKPLPWVRIRELGARLDEPLSDDPPESPLMALAERVGRVDILEPELYFGTAGDPSLHIRQLEEQLQEDELDARLEDALAEEANEEPAAPAPGRERKLEANGERLRAFFGRAFGEVEVSFDALSAFAMRLGTRLPVREIHVAKGKFLYREDIESGSLVRGRLYNFHLDAVRQPDEQVFSFDMRFETPESDRSSNRVEGKVHLVTRDLQVRARISRLNLARYRALLPPWMRLGAATTLHDTDLTLIFSTEDRELRLEGQVFLTDAEIAHPALARDPLSDMDLGAELGLTLDMAGHKLSIDPSRFYLNAVSVTVGGTIDDYERAARLDLEMDLPRTDMMDIVRSVPLALTPRLDGVKMTGSLAATLKLTLDTADLRTLRYDIDTKPIGVHVTSMGKYVDLGALMRPFVHEVEERDGTVTRFRVGPGAPGWVAYEDVSPYVTQALTTTEDGRFFYHDGFSYSQIRSSIIANLERGYFYRGASTISQQLVKNLFLSRDKTIARKLQEAFITWQLERYISKERIIELYLNIIEWGPKIYGIRQASEHYFGIEPNELTLLDTAFLVSIIPNPVRFYSQFERGEVTPRWQARIRRIIEAMQARGKISAGEMRAAAPYKPFFKGQRRPDDTRWPTDNNPTPRDNGAPATTGGQDDGIPMPGGH